jgi:RNA polymerase sigma factor (sigma-70 family)
MCGCLRPHLGKAKLRACLKPRAFSNYNTRKALGGVLDIRRCSMSEDTLRMIEGLKTGDEAAAREVFTRFAGQLVAYVQRRLAGQFARRFDAEDVVQSACGSFFAGARAERFELKDSNDLWNLLLAIALNKLRNKVEHHSAAKRGVGLEDSLGGDADVLAASRGPAPPEQTALWEEVELLTRDLDDVKRKIVELRLQGWLLEEIATKIDRSERMVRRVLDQVKQGMLVRLGESPG